MNVNFEIRKKGTNHNVLKQRGSFDVLLDGREFIAMLNHYYPVESHLYAFWTESLANKEFDISPLLNKD